MTDTERRESRECAAPRRVVQSVLDRVRRRWRAVAWMAAFSRATFGIAGVLATAALLDRVGGPVDLALVGLAIAAGVVAVAVALKLSWSARHRPSDVQVARYIEEHQPEFEDRLVSATGELMTDGDRGPFGALVLEEAARHADDLDVAAIVGDDVVRAAGIKMLAAGVCLALALFVARDPAGRALQVVWLHAFPSAFSLDVHPGDARVVAGQAMTIRAEFLGAVGASGGILPELTVDDGVETRSVAMTADGSAFVFEIPKVTDDFTYHVHVASTTSPEYRVSALFPPHIERIDVHYDYPRFTGLAPRFEEDGGDVYAPAGTQVRMTVYVDKPIEAAAMVMGDGERRELAVGPDAGTEATSGGVLEASLEVSRDGSYRIGLLDLDGLTNPGGTEYFIRVMDDRPPEVRILRPGGDREISSLEEVTIEARADDDYGVASFELVYSVRGRRERAVQLGRGGGATTLNGKYVLFVEDLSVAPGDFVTYYARARDVSRAKQSTEARSDIFFLEVKPFEEEFVAAQSQSMMGNGGAAGSLDELVEAQKAVIVATWKLERRSTGGKSVDDIRAVGRAQVELQDRTRAAASDVSGVGGRRRGGAAQADAADAPPLELATVAMGEAAAELDELMTADALPHEMEALNQLLKAQAQIRRRQVARQQAQGGGGGTSGAQQDLSALFDRELQRQQETNYETPSGGSQDQQEPESDALRKVRELARRQDELSRQQRELARQRANMTTEELKRRLERLTREQSDLRQQAEELSRELGRDGNQGRARQEGQQPGQQAGQASGQQASQQSGESSPGGPGQSGGDQMRGISEDIQRATSELRRSDPGQASQRADRALAGLRELERELLGGQPEQQRRARGELQLESQQVANAQRRIAGEARRLDPSSPSAAAMRRLADEREQLAGRVDDLARRLRELGRNMTAEQGDALADAASALERAEVSTQMREAAAALRESEGAMAQAAGQPDSTNPGETTGESPGPFDADQMARVDDGLTETLDRVARQLGDTANGQDEESRRLSEQLARSNELRQRLSDIQEQLQRFEATAAQGSQQQGAPPGGETSQAGSEPGESAQANAGGRGDAGVASLQQAYRQQLRETLELMEALQEANPQMGGAGRTPEAQQLGQSAPGTEAFKQDYAAWDVLRRDVTLALEELEASLSRRLNERESEDRLDAGSDQRMPEDYRSLVSQYYRALAAKKRN